MHAHRLFGLSLLGLLSLHSHAATLGTTTVDTFPRSCLSNPDLPRDWSLVGGMNYGRVVVGYSLVKTLTIKNGMCAPSVTFNQISFSSGFSANAGKNPPASLTLKPGQSYSFEVQFKPTLIQGYRGTIAVYSSRGNKSTSASGTGIANIGIELSGNLNFDTVMQGESKTLPLSISNPGTSTLKVSSISYPAGFSGAWSGNIAAGSSQLVSVQFSPNAVQAYGGMLSVNSNKTIGSHQATLQGAGIAPVVVSGSNTIATTDNQIHTYYYRAPAVATPAAGRPVLIYLHGDGGTGASGSQAFYPFTDPDGTLIVSPSGTNKTWSHYAADVAGQAQDSQFIEKIVQQLKTGQFNGQRIDTKRIYLAGSSRGAYMPYYLLQRSGTRNQFAAVAINAGLVYCQAGDAECSGAFGNNLHSATTPIIHVHGSNDTAVAPPPLAVPHNPINWNEDWKVFNPIKFFAFKNGCFDNSLASQNARQINSFITSAGKTATGYDLQPKGASCSKYQLYIVTEGGHVPRGMEKTIWDFLKQYSSP